MNSVLLVTSIITFFALQLWAFLLVFLVGIFWCQYSAVLTSFGWRWRTLMPGREGLFCPLCIPLRLKIPGRHWQRQASQLMTDHHFRLAGNPKKLMKTTLRELQMLLRNPKASGSPSWIVSSPNHSTAIISEVWFLIWNHSVLSIDVPLRDKLTNFESLDLS